MLSRIAPRRVHKSQAVSAGIRKPWPYSSCLTQRPTSSVSEVENAAIAARTVQGFYSDQLLRMVVVVTAVATLLTYAGYTQTREADFLLRLSAEEGGFSLNLLWLTILPAMYALIRCITLLERGEHDDPTELATKDLPFQLAAGVFALITVVLVLVRPMLNASGG